MRYEYRTENVCSRKIEFDINGNVITNVSFTGGCNGNLKAISKLVDGMTVEKIEENERGFYVTVCIDEAGTDAG